MERKIALAGLAVNLALGIAKIAVGVVASSSAILADGLHSGMDSVSSGISFVGIRASKKPVDEEHPYGHYKAEVIGGLFITVILFLTGIWIIYEAVLSFLSPVLPVVSLVSAGVMAASAAVNEAMARLKIGYGKRYDSMSLLSDGVHSRVDVYTSAAVLAGLLLSAYFIYADSLMAALIGVFIIWESLSLGRKATDSLLDVSAGDEVEQKIREIAKRQNIEVSGLKTQKRGHEKTANIEVELPSGLTVEDATRITGSLREELMREIANLEYVAVQIKGREVSIGYFRPSFGMGRGFGWQRVGRMHGEALGPGGHCVCPKCSFKVEHEMGVPCSSLECPKCGASMTREAQNA